MALDPVFSGLGGTPLSRSQTMPGTAVEAARGFVQTLREAETQATASVTGSADPHALVTALAESKLAVDTVVTIRDRVVEAYQEVMRMPV